MGSDRSAQPVELARAVFDRTRLIVGALEGEDVDLEGPSLLPDWSRLTIVCHLRYGLRASLRMTNETLRGEESSFYPGKRSVQRPATLVPEAGEDPGSVLRSLSEESANLNERWEALSQVEWETSITEPSDNPDLGSRMKISDLALLRLTEVEVHGGDLDVGIGPWSAVFVDSALPTRLSWLPIRRTNNLAVDREAQGSWKLASPDGFEWFLSVTGDEVKSVQVDPLGSRPEADCLIEGTKRDLLALLLGRPLDTGLSYSGDEQLARAFKRAFPGP